jgi:two-component system, cell cycle sensor histidine kinase and response regulator CckA
MIRHQALFEAVRDAIFLVDADTGLIVDANRAGESLCGRSLAELRSLCYMQLTAESAEQPFPRDTGLPTVTEGIVLHKDGGRIPVEISSSHFTDTDGIRIMVGVFRDLTERNAGREKLRKSEERFRQVAESAGEFIWEVDAAGLYLYASPVVEQILGYTPEEIVGRMHFYELFVPETREEVKRSVFGIFARHEPFRRFVTWKVGKDGRTVALETSGVPILDGNGKLLGYRGTGTEVTERKRAEEALRENERRLSSIYNTVRDIIFHLAVEPDGQFRFVSVNAAFLSTTGLSLESVVGKTVSEVILEPSLSMVLGKYRQAVEERAIVLWEETSDYPAGRLTGEVSIAPVVDDKGTCTHLVGSVHDITERKRAEAALSESEERFRDLADTAPVLIWVSGPDKLCTFFNKPWLDFTGRTMEEEFGNGWATSVHPDDLKRCLVTYSSSFNARRSFKMEYRMRRADGVFRWLLDSGIPRYRDGEFTGYLGSCIDVTEQKMIEERLRASEVRLMEAQRLANVGSWEMDLNTERIYWSDEMFRIFGRAGDAPANQAELLMHIHPEDHQALSHCDQQLLSKRGPVEAEYRILRPDGEVRFVRSIVEAIRNGEGAPVRIVGAMHDTTGQVQARELLRESEERLKNAERIAHIGNWRWDSRNGRMFWSEELLQIFGVPRDFEPTYERLIQMVAPKDRERTETWFHECLAGRGDRFLDFQIVRPTGELRTIACIIETDQEGVPITSAGTCQDITDSRRAQDEAFARQTLESVGTLASGIAHDFNNLLGAVLAQADLALAELADGSRPEEELQRIREVAIRGAEIVRQLMIYAGKESESSEMLDVSRIVREMLTLLRVSVSKNVVLETDLSDDLPSIRGNPSQLRRITLNLVTNASEAMGHRGGTIRLSTARVVPGRTAEKLPGVAEGDYLSLEVADNGSGMPPTIQARVFDPFFTTKSAGRGLGLAVVQGIVRSLQGTIHLLSDPDKGTTFQILLPIAETAAKANAEPIQPAEEASPALHESTVLIVEDEDRLRSAVVKLLRKSGFHVLEAGDGSAAIDLLHAKGSEIDIVLLDMTIPGRSSQDVVAEAAQAWPGIKVFLTSAYSEEMITANMSAPTIRGFIRKPFQHGDLVQLLRRALRVSSERAPTLDRGDSESELASSHGLIIQR